MEYSLDLLDPRTVVLRLPGTTTNAAMPQAGSDPVISKITANRNSQGLDIIVQTASAGSTVQPSFDSTNNSLVLEFRGSSGAASPQAPTISDTPPKVTAITLGGRNDVVRLTLGGDKAMRATVTSKGDVVYLNLARGGLSPDVVISGSDQRVLAMEVQNPNPFAVMLKLSRPLSSYQITPQPNGMILDMALGETRVPTPPPASSRPVTIPGKPAAPTPTTVPSTALAPEPPAPESVSAGNVDAPATVPVAVSGILAPSSVASISGGSARGSLPPPPAETPGGLTVISGEEPDDDRPPAMVGSRQPQGGTLGGGILTGDLALAQAHLNDGRYAEALSGFEMVLASGPTHEEAAIATYGMAEAYFRLNQKNITRYYTRIMDLYQAAMVKYPDSDQVPKAMLMMGRAASLAGESFRAQAYYRWVNSRYYRSDAAGWSQIYLGNLMNQDGNHPEAIKIFSDVLERWPDSKFTNDAQLGLLQSYFGLNRWQEAVDMLNAMLERNPGLYLERPEMLHYMGEAYYQLEDYPKARDYLLWAINLRPNLDDADILLTRIGDVYRYEKAWRASTEMYNEVVNAFPGSDGSQVAKMRLSEVVDEDKEHPWEIFQVKATNSAYKIYQDIIAQFNDRPVGQLARLKLAVWYYKTTAFAQSIQTVQDLLSAHPDTIFQAEAAYVLDVASRAWLGELREEDNPVRLLSEYVRLRPFIKEPESNDILDKLAWAYEKTGLNSKAAYLYQVLATRQLDNPDYWVDAARNLFVDDQQEEVLATLQEVNLDELSDAKQSEFLYLEGVSLSRQGNYAEAALALSALIGKDPELNDAGQVYMNLGSALNHMPGRAVDALRALDLAEYEFNKASDPATAQTQRLLTALLAGRIAQQQKDTDKALVYLQRALSLSADAKDKAPILYEIFLSQRALNQAQEMMRSLEDLSALKVSPWSSMADRLIADYKLNPELERLGRSLEQSSGRPQERPDRTLELMEPLPGDNPENDAENRPNQPPAAMPQAPANQPATPQPQGNQPAMPQAPGSQPGAVRPGN